MTEYLYWIPTAGSPVVAWAHKESTHASQVRKTSTGTKTKTATTPITMMSMCHSAMAISNRVILTEDSVRTPILHALWRKTTNGLLRSNHVDHSCRPCRRNCRTRASVSRRHHETRTEERSMRLPRAHRVRIPKGSGDIRTVSPGFDSLGGYGQYVPTHIEKGSTMATRARRGTAQVEETPVETPQNSAPGLAPAGLTDLPTAWAGGDVAEFNGHNPTDKEDLVDIPFLIIGAEVERNENRGYDTVWVYAL